MGPREALPLLANSDFQAAVERSRRWGEEQFRRLADESFTGMFIVQDGRFVYVNKRLARLFGHDSPRDLIDRRPLRLLARSNRGDLWRHLWVAGSGAPGLVAWEGTGLRKDGTTVEIGINARSAEFLGRPALVGMLQDISEKKRHESEIHRSLERLRSTLMQTVEVAMRLGEMRDPYTAGHQRRVAELAVAIGAELGLDASRIEGLRVAGYLHDIGKMTVPTEILVKPTHLAPAELALVREHSRAGFEAIKGVDFPWPVAQVALQHHERMDGSGYPQGLAGEQILFEARIMAVADVVEAMSSHRPYRAARGIESALEEIEAGRATLFDPSVVDACLRLFREKGYAIPVS
jgi:PAS domain S-box-containing protein/putative nucleotidyltransferase with HDIG domain